MFRKTLRWLIVLLGLAGAAGGAGVWYAWVRADELLRAEVTQRLAEIAPHCDIKIGSARFDWNRSVRVKDFVVRPKSKPGASPAIALPEAIIRIDRERFLTDRKVDIQSIRLLRPRLEVTRRVDGSWSWNDLLPIHLPDPTMPFPEWEIEDATIRFRLEQEGLAEPVVLTLQDADLRLVPSGRRQVLVRGLTDVGESGPLQVTGRIDLDRKIWSLSGSLTRLSTSGTIAGFALKTSPHLREKLAMLGQRLKATEHALLGREESRVASESVPARFASSTNGVPVRVIPGINVAVPAQPDGLPTAAIPAPPPADLTALGLNAVVDVKFSIGQSETTAPLGYQVWIDCRDGQVVNPLLPFALRHLRGSVYWDAGQVKLTELRADGGGTSVKIDAAFRLPDGPSPVGEGAPIGSQDSAGSPDNSGQVGEVEELPVASGSVSVAVVDLPVSDHYPGRLPVSIERFLEVVHPHGPMDVVGTFDRDPAGAWSVKALTLTAKGASAQPEAFPYPIRDITGTLRLTGPKTLEARMVGKAGVKPVSLHATIENAGPAAEVGLAIIAQDVALDETLRDALKPAARDVVAKLGVEGFADFDLRLTRPPGLDQKYRWTLDATVRQGEIEYETFPYRLTGVGGRVIFDSKTDVWTLSEITAAHDKGRLFGAGTFRKTDEGLTALAEMPPQIGVNPTIAAVPPGLTFDFTAENLVLGNDVRAALPPALKATWDQFRPSGTVQLGGGIRWMPGGEPEIRLSRCDLTNGTFAARAFQYPLDNITAKLTYAPGTLKLSELTARHEDTWVQVTNAQLQRLPDAEWLLTMPALNVDNLRLGGDFSRAASDGLRTALASLEPRGAMNIVGSIELRGSTNPAVPMTAGWDLGLTLADNHFRAGLDLENVYGTVRLSGTYNGRDTSLNGSLLLDRADVFGNRLENVRGPFRYSGGGPEGGDAEIGTAAAVPRNLNVSEDQPVARENRIRADFLGGQVTLDLVMKLADPARKLPLRYAGRVTLVGGRLERYAPILSDAKNLAGVLTGWVNFSATGADPGDLDGKGQLFIEPAALYELPVMIQMFAAMTRLSSRPMDKAAFNFARIEFTIAKRTFSFPFIDLAGDRIRFVGRGQAGFDERLSLDFYSMLPHNRMDRVPLVGPLAGAMLDAFGTGWIGIEVRGKISAPVAHTVPAKGLDDTLRTFLNSLGPPRRDRAATAFPAPPR